MNSAALRQMALDIIAMLPVHVQASLRQLELHGVTPYYRDVGLMWRSWGAYHSASTFDDQPYWQYLQTCHDWLAANNGPWIVAAINDRFA